MLRCRSTTSSLSRPASRASSAAYIMPTRHRGAVPPLVSLGVLDRVAERVTVVEDLAQARLLEVLADDAGLDADRKFDHAAGTRRCVGSVAAVDVGLDDVEDLGARR